MFSEVIPLDSESLKGELAGLLYEIKIFVQKTVLGGKNMPYGVFGPIRPVLT